MQKLLIILGLLVLLAGISWPWLKQLPLGQLPGDIAIGKQNFRFYFPITTMILISALVTLILWALKK